MIDVNTVRPLLAVFRSQGQDTVYVASCCGRVYVGATAATTCRTCKQSPKNYPVKTDGTDIQSLQQE
jgi:hypothetical protein